MKPIHISLVFLMVLFTACSSIKVTTDYDDAIAFESYNTFAFYKPGIDKAKISDLDKKRILKAIETQMLSKGFQKSTTPDVLVSIFTKSREKVNISQNNRFGFGWGFGWGFNPWMWGMMGPTNDLNVSNYSEGTLFIDVIDAKSRKLIWQGVGTGALKLENRDKKVARIQKFVTDILENYPPQKN